MIKGIPVTLFERAATGEVDAFNRPVVSTVQTTVENVLVAPMTETEILDVMNLTGRRAVYQLALPKGDNHDWTDARVDFFGSSWHVIGDVLEGQEEMIPLSWNKKIRVERING